MKVIEAIKNRRSIRNFIPDKEISHRQLNILLEAARWAPSAGNLQSRFFIIVRSRALKKIIADLAHGQDFIISASVVIVICADIRKAEASYGKRGRKLYAIQDASAAAQNILLTAEELGLSGCWIGSFAEQQLKKILNINQGLRPVCLLALGYSQKKPILPARKKITQISRFFD